MASDLGTASTAAVTKRPPSRLFLAVVIVIPLVVVVVVALAIRTANETTRQLGMNSMAQLVVVPPSQQRTPGPVALRRLGGGTPVAIGGATGKPLVVNFWASWCPACRRELSAIAAVARTSPVRIVGVDTDDTSAPAMSVLRQAGARYPVGVGLAPLAEAYGTANLPTTAFVDSKGRVVALYLGAITKSELTRLIRELAAGKPL